MMDMGAASTSTDDSSALLEEYKRKLDVVCSQNAENISNKVYGKELIQLVRDINKNFHVVPCPLSEAELLRMGIDLGTMPATKPPSYARFFQYLAENDRPGLVKYYEDKLEKLLNDPKIAKDISHRIYSRELIHFVREINQTFHIIPCPVDKRLLMELNIIPNENPKTGKKENHSKSKPPVPLKEKRKQKVKNKFASGTSSGSPVELHKCSDPWKPVFSLDYKFSPITGCFSTLKITRYIRGILNRITPSNYNELSTEILEKQIWNDLKTLPAVVDLIFSKAIEDQIYVDIYADLCLDLFNAEEDVAKDQCNFLNALALKCQGGLNSIVLNYEKEFLEIEEKITNENDEKTKKVLKDDLEEMKIVKKLRSFGFLRFISHLCKVPVLHFKTIQNCYNRLITKSKESESDFALLMEFATVFVGIVGPQVAEKNEDPEHISVINEYVSYLEQQKSLLPYRIKFLVMDLVDLRNNEWKL